MNEVISKFQDKAFWTQLVPTLGIEDPDSFKDLEMWSPPEGDEALRRRLDREGYLHFSGLHERLKVERLADAVRALAKIGIPPVFCMVFDQFWIPAFSINKLMTAAFGADYFLLPDFWIWHVDPKKVERGWKPHREKGHKSLFPDRRPKALSAWLALSEATPLNSCMYIVPADRDPTYGTEQDTQWKFELPDVRALPAQAGDVFMWTQGLLHWGAHASPDGACPRISMAFEFQHGGIEPLNQPLLQPLAILRFADRLKLIGKQVIQYKHMYTLSPDLEAVARALVGNVEVKPAYQG
jgi:phytanoyl-CoA dioxygenase PhyH